MKLLFDILPSILERQGRDIYLLLTSGRFPGTRLISTREELPRKLLPPKEADTQTSPYERTPGFLLAIINSQGQPFWHVLPPSLTGGSVV